MFSKICYCVTLCSLLLLTGCHQSDIAKVKGTVTYNDGSPVTHGCVTFDSGSEKAFGMLNEKGQYAVGRIKDGDGIPFGVYQVWLTNTNITSTTMANTGGMQMSMNSTTTATVHPKYTSKTTSGLSFEAKQGGPNVFDFVVEKPDKVDLKVN